MRMRRYGVGMLVLLALVGCGSAETQSTATAPASTPGPTVVTGPTMVPTPAGATDLDRQAVDRLARFLSVDAATLSVESAETREWSSSALGCPASGQMYLQVITPGMLITVKADGKTYEIHASNDGTMVLCDGGQPTPLDAGGSSAPAPEENQMNPTSLHDKIIAKHAADFKVDPATITIVSSEDVQWSSSGLGCEQPGQMYMTVIVAGTRVVLEQDGKQYNYHTDLSGDRIIRCDRAPRGMGKFK